MWASPLLVAPSEAQQHPAAATAAGAPAASPPRVGSQFFKIRVGAHSYRKYRTVGAQSESTHQFRRETEKKSCFGFLEAKRGTFLRLAHHLPRQTSVHQALFSFLLSSCTGGLAHRHTHARPPTLPPVSVVNGYCVVTPGTLQRHACSPQNPNPNPPPLPRVQQTAAVVVSGSAES